MTDDGSDRGKPALEGQNKLDLNRSRSHHLTHVKFLFFLHFHFPLCALPNPYQSPQLLGAQQYLFIFLFFATSLQLCRAQISSRNLFNLQMHFASKDDACILKLHWVSVFCMHVDEKYITNTHTVIEMEGKNELG